MEGKGPSQITALLEKEKVLNPTAYKPVSYTHLVNGVCKISALSEPDVLY